MSDKNSISPELEVKFNGVRAEIGRILQEATDLGNSVLQRRSGYTWTIDFLNQLAKTQDKWRRQRFQVAIMALMKSGKLTLINAWLGKEFLPAGVLAETARIVRIRHNPDRPQGILCDEEQELEYGAESIQKYLRGLNRDVRDSNALPPEDELVLEAPLVALFNQSLGSQGFEILDTPGPNEYGLDILRSKIDRILRDVDVVVYVLDVTKLKTDDEKRVLDSLAERKDLIRDLSKRMFFVVNKIDVLNRHDRIQNLTSDEIRQHIVSILQQQIEGLNITKDQVFLISAENALLARLVQSGQASVEQQRDFDERVFGGLRDEDDPPTEEEYQAAAPRWLKKSGLLYLENEVLSFIYEHRTYILFHSIIDEIERTLIQVMNNLDVGRATLLADRIKVENLQCEIREIRNELKGIEKTTEKFREKTTKNIRGKWLFGNRGTRAHI